MEDGTSKETPEISKWGQEDKTTLIAGLDVVAKIAIAIVTAFWAFHTYPESKEKDFRRAYWDKQMALFFDVTETAARIATRPPSDLERDKAIAKFWELYWGKMVVVESKCEECDSVSRRMVAFGRCLVNPKYPAPGQPFDKCDGAEFTSRAHAIAKACRDGIATSWDEKLKSLTLGCTKGGTCPGDTTEE